ncbi:MAG: hypothetical protein B7Y83_06185 [Flavobacteriales bacterium 32-34-25]|nr:MAG: hypothetical protein B7Y83_06185 [Flavobacteriales bacterium 32-34-25]
MKNVLLLVLIFSFNLVLSQNKIEIDSLLNEIAKTNDSKEISKTEPAKKIIEYKTKLLPTLADFFTDKTITNVKSECIGRNLTKGEIAIIIADRIELIIINYIGFYHQNCLMSTCENNTNLIEFYLPFIQSVGTEKFQEKYKLWLLSDERYKTILPEGYESERKIRKKEYEKAKLIIIETK